MRPDFAEHLKQIDIDWMRSKGIPPEAIIFSTFAGDEICRARVTYSQCGRFFDPFEAGSDPGEAVTAYVWTARDSIGDPADVVAWHPRTGRLATIEGSIPVIGEENVFAPRLDEALSVFDNPLAWLADGRRGVLLLPGRDPAAVETLRLAGPLAVESLSLAERLASAHEAALQILVPQFQRQAA